MNRGHVLAGAVATVLLFAAPTPSHAQFSCNVGSLAGNCTIDAPQAVTGDTSVVGDLTVTSSGSLDYGSGTAEINVGGDLTVDGTIGARVSLPQTTPGRMNGADRQGEVWI